MRRKMARPKVDFWSQRLITFVGATALWMALLGLLLFFFLLSGGAARIAEDIIKVPPASSPFTRPSDPLRGVDP